MEENHYKTLEIPESSSMEEIKKAYRKLSLKHHPDRNIGKPDEKEMFQKISAAFEVLGSQEKKQEYDAMLRHPYPRMSSFNHGNNRGGGGVHAFHNMDDILSQMFFGGGGLQQENENPFEGMFPPGLKMHAFRNGVAMPFPSSSSSAMQNVTPIIQTIHINMEQVLMGSTMPVEVERWILEEDTKVFEKETLYVNIPKGIDDNEIIILKGKGNVVNDKRKGDVKLFIKIENLTEFKRNGLDLLLDKRITLKESLCGFAFEVKYINGKTYTINNQSGNIIPPGFIKTIPNMGLTREGHTGNLRIHFKVDFPDTLKEDQIAKLKDIL